MQLLTISVVIPVYNREKTIHYCLNSVLGQTLSPLEVIIVDDCSTDETVNIVRAYADPRIRCVVLGARSGAQAARNRGILEAKGDWIAFQDSDDEWLPDKLEKQVNALKNVGYDPWTVIHASAIWFNAMTNQQQLVDLPLIEGNYVYPLLLAKPAPFLQSMLVSRIALEKISYLDENVPSYQEWDTSIRLAKHCRFLFIKDPLFVYYLHEGDTLSKDQARDIVGYQFVIYKFRDDIIRVCGKQTWEDHLYTQLARCLKFRLWSDADRYARLIEIKTFKFWVFKLYRILRLSHYPLVIFFNNHLRTMKMSAPGKLKGENSDAGKNSS